MTIDESIAHALEVAGEQQKIADSAGLIDIIEGLDVESCKECAADHRQLAEWLKELKEARRLVAQLKAKICDSSEYCAYCDELDMTERDHFTCKYKKKKIPAVCHWQLLTPAHFDNIPWTENKI